MRKNRVIECVLYRDASLSQVVATWNRLKTEEQELFKRARPTKKYVSRFEAYKSSILRRMWNSAEFMRPSALRDEGLLRLSRGEVNPVVAAAAGMACVEASS